MDIKIIEWAMRVFILGLAATGAVFIGRSAGLEGEYVLVASIPICMLAGLFLSTLENR